MKRPFHPARLAAALSLTLATSAFAQAVVVAPIAPPAPRDEVVPPARAGYVWDHGRWRWEHGAYVWQPVRVGYHWVPGHWVAHGPNWHWVPGHWA
ncbi:YXWGXW repeat-containing protein [Burkholderia glumae]|uniref:YXWGXW repeat-containing protein n=1 Tax=Burkholderia glumae TaxID=337 RepID=A0AAQ0BPS4_BURGL|nr:YXWGXW repeat-containing protein [Burkholderia glumae]ACR32239.1 Hypothetical protein bglu_2g19140 [Burkholderia glumae BGR1]AJY63097.1 YXWGXW repeat family protein [Burkholderia glumae LMG 2196 = ATCC 33617]KHJ60733.1 lipoprotein [Burkholderia glumae]MCM2484569.1 YXWGXW repeat-containing protein [Burkholderia glumae]MCM2510261.1 YXWGXW repeat-containing protein [Burkholderia glumae]